MRLPTEYGSVMEKPRSRYSSAGEAVEETKMKKIIWILGFSLAFIAAVLFAGYVGFTKSMSVMMAPAGKALSASVVPRPAPLHDAGKPTVAILLGNTPTEPTDFLGPYAMFGESGAYNVYAVASSRSLRTLAGGLDVVPQLSFAELAAQLPRGPDIIVVPAMANVGSPDNVPVLDWLRQQGHGSTLLFSWCEGAEVLAASGLIDGKNVTTHWASVGRYERAYPAVNWQRGQRYIDSGTLLTTAGLTSGIDATLHLLERQNGSAVAAKVARALHIPPSAFISNTRMQQYSIEPSDINFLLNLAFGWPKDRIGLWLYDGIGELDVTAVIDVYQATNPIYTVGGMPSVVSRHGLQFVPRWNPQNLPVMNRILIAGSDGGERTEKLPAGLGGPDVRVKFLEDKTSPAFPFQTTLEDLAREQDRATAAFAAKRLEVRSTLNLVGRKWPVWPLLVLSVAGFAGVIALSGVAWLVRWGRS